MKPRIRNLAQILEQRRPGESIAALARRFGVTAQSLYNFRSKSKKSAQPESHFLPVQLLQTPSEDSPELELHFQSGVKLVIPPKSDMQSLRGVLTVLLEAL